MNALNSASSQETTAPFVESPSIEKIWDLTESLKISLTNSKFSAQSKIAHGRYAS